MTTTLANIYNFLPIDERWATAGQPTVAQFAAIKAAGYEAIINLGMPDSPRAVVNEVDLVAAQGIDYVACPAPVVSTCRSIWRQCWLPGHRRSDEHDQRTLRRYFSGRVTFRVDRPDLRARRTRGCVDERW